MSWRRDLLNRAAPLLPRRLLIMRGASAKKRVALTFDDGPDDMTLSYLDLLDGMRVPATFFVIGENCARHPEKLAEMVRRGHEVAGHSYTHRRFPTLSSAELTDELMRTAALLPPPWRRPIVRPPQGRATPLSLYRCAAQGFATMLWSLDSNDWTAREPGPVVESLAPDRVSPGEIILLHEGQRWTLDALPTVIERLLQAGFELVRASELVWP